MNIYVTTGTINYFLKVKEEHPDFYLNGNGERGIAYYEAEESKHLFNAGNSYEVRNSYGELSEDLPLLATFINVSQSKDATTRGMLYDLTEGLESLDYIASYRVGKKDYSYVVLIQFKDSEKYSDFEESELYQNNISKAALQRLKDVESMFGNANSQSFYVPIADLDEEDIEDSF